ncbi:MAG TPA: hypothetical protein VMU57_04230, partial [Edaphobacter sp.]|uniref:hypothetical protein n=1 Tax=Edaphobacter sp. TaxID=1934404 RepID=UPI002CBAA824
VIVLVGADIDRVTIEALWVQVAYKGVFVRVEPSTEVRKVSAVLLVYCTQFWPGYSEQRLRLQAHMKSGAVTGGNQPLFIGEDP